MEEQRTPRSLAKIPKLLAAHKSAIIEELGSRAFDLLTPKQVQDELGLTHGARVPDLTRQGWLEPAPGKDIGPAHLYYRWRVEFVKRHKRTYTRRKPHRL